MLSYFGPQVERCFRTTLKMYLTLDACNLKSSSSTFVRGSSFYVSLKKTVLILSFPPHSFVPLSLARLYTTVYEAPISFDKIYTSGQQMRLNQLKHAWISHPVPIYPTENRQTENVITLPQLQSFS